MIKDVLNIIADEIVRPHIQKDGWIEGPFPVRGFERPITVRERV